MLPDPPYLSGPPEDDEDPSLAEIMEDAATDVRLIDHALATYVDDLHRAADDLAYRIFCVVDAAPSIVQVDRSAAAQNALAEAMLAAATESPPAEVEYIDDLRTQLKTVAEGFVPGGGQLSREDC